MHGGQLEACIDAIPLLRKHTGGIYPADRLPPQPSTANRAVFFIVNTQGKALPGEHWVCMLFPIGNAKHPEFFDSYSMLPERYHTQWNGYLTQRTGSFRTLNQPIQDFFSNTCGAHCLLFAHTRLQGDSFETVVRKYYSGDTCSNDSVAALYVQKLCQFNKNSNNWLTPAFQICTHMFLNVL